MTKLAPILASTLVLAFTSLAPLPARAAEFEKGVIATVDGRQISRAEFEKAYGKKKSMFKSRYGVDLDSLEIAKARVKTKIVSELVEERIIRNEAERRNLNVDSKDVARKLEEMKQRFRNDKEHAQALADLQIQLSDVLASINEELLRERVFEAVTHGIGISDADVSAYYDANIDQFKRAEVVALRHILVKDQKLSSELVSQLKNGASFADLAAKYSEDTATRSKAGDLGLIRRGELVPQIEDVAFALPVGQLSDPVKTQFGYHILTITGHFPSRLQPFTEIQSELRARLITEKKQQVFEHWLASKKDSGDILYAPGFAPAPSGEDAD